MEQKVQVVEEIKRKKPKRVGQANGKSNPEGLPWLSYHCPLALAQTLKTGAVNRSMELQRDQESMEKGFVVDGVITAITATLPGRSVIPPYNAVRDKYASAYFQSPGVRAIIERNLVLRELKNSRNKLSTRKRCKATPSVDELRRRRDNFVMDSVRTESTRSRFTDVIPAYHAQHDRNCKKYFQRSDIERLLNLTLKPRSLSS